MPEFRTSFVKLDGSTKHQSLAEGMRGCGAAIRPGCGMFSYSSFEKIKKTQSWAGLWAYSVSGTNKRGDSSHFTLDKQSEAVRNGRRSCRNSKTKMKERQLHWASLGPYRDCWVLCQTMTIISGPCCVKSSKSPPPLFLSLSPLSYAPGWIMQTKFSQSL